VALFQLEESSNEETEFELVRFSENGCGCSHNGIVEYRFCKIKRRKEIHPPGPPHGLTRASTRSGSTNNDTHGA
jgi:hypothetical protein